jgi:hypothetical protein
MELELKRPPKLKVKLDEKIYELTQMKIGAVLELERSENKSAAVIAALVNCGMPESVLIDMEFELLEQLISVLKPEKKT